MDSFRALFMEQRTAEQRNSGKAGLQDLFFEEERMVSHDNVKG